MVEPHTYRNTTYYVYPEEEKFIELDDALSLKVIDKNKRHLKYIFGELTDNVMLKLAKLLLADRFLHAVKKLKLPMRRPLFKTLTYIRPKKREVLMINCVVEEPVEITLNKETPLDDKLYKTEVNVLETIRKKNYFDGTIMGKVFFARTALFSNRVGITTRPFAGGSNPNYNFSYGSNEYLEDIEKISQWIKDLTKEGIEPNPGPKNGKGQNKRRRVNRNRRQQIVLAERPGLIMPPRHVATLMYVDNAYVRNNPGNNFLVYSFRINDLYDPDPLILSGSLSGFKELMQFYQYYRVLNFSANINISNNEAFDIFYGAVFSQSNLTGTIASRDDAANALENNYAKGPFLLSEKTGMDRGTMVLRIRPSSLLGVPKQYFADTNYSGNGLATPTIPLWLNFIVYTPTGAALTNGYTTATKFFFKAEFFGRLNLRA